MSARAADIWTVLNGHGEAPLILFLPMQRLSTPARIMEVIASAVPTADATIRPQSTNWIVSSVSFVSTTNTVKSLAGFVSPALALTPWSPGSSKKLSPAL